jgi:hypothetical protein
VRGACLTPPRLHCPTAAGPLQESGPALAVRRYALDCLPRAGCGPVSDGLGWAGTRWELGRWVNPGRACREATGPARHQAPVSYVQGCFFK